MSEIDEADLEALQYVDDQIEDSSDAVNSSGEHSIDSVMENTVLSNKGDALVGIKKILQADHPLLTKYQENLKEKYLRLLQETDEELLDLQRAISTQEKENDHFAKQGFEFQNQLLLQEEKLNEIYLKYDEQIKNKEELQTKTEAVKKIFQKIEKKLQAEQKKDLEYQKQVEDIAFKVVQLTALQNETFTDAKSLQRAVEKTAKDRENLEIQKLRQDLLIFRLENDAYNLEDKINLYKTQWAIKKEEVVDLRKELNAAHTEMELINFERQQIVQQWRQSLSSLEKQDKVLSEIRSSARSFEDDMQTLKMKITAHKKSVRKELERNEMLTITLQFRESDVARSKKELSDVADKENNLQENLSVIEKIIDISENELKFLNDGRIFKEKELEAKERDIQKYCNVQRNLEEKHMDVLHQKITVTKASKYIEKLIKDVRNSISVNEEKGSKKENEKQKQLLEIDNLKTYLNKIELNLEELQKESKQRGVLLDKSEANVVKVREKIDIRRNEYKNLDNELQELIIKAGGEELAPFERELANLRKEIIITEQSKRDTEQEYLRFQRELFSLSKQNSVRNEENDMYKKRVVIMEGKKFRLEADIAKEEKDLKDTQNRIRYIEKDITQINKLLHERKELQECLKQAAELSKSDFYHTLKEAELNFLEREAELIYLRKKKSKFFSKVMEIQKHIVFWEQKLHLAEETRRVLKSDEHLNDIFKIKSEIRRLQVKLDQIKKEQDNLVQEMERAVYYHTKLYVEADKQALFGKRRKTPEYVKKRIKNNIMKIRQDKKALDDNSKKLELLKTMETQLEENLSQENSVISEMAHKISSLEHNTDFKQQEKRQAIIRLSYKQKKSKYFQKVKDGTYIRAVRNQERRPDEIKKIQNNLRAIQVIIEAIMNEYPLLINELSKVFDYIIVSKEF